MKNDRKMKISAIFSSKLLVFIMLVVLFLPFGRSLKCYSYICSNSSEGSSPSCTPPQEVFCSPMDDIPMEPDRCITQRFLTETSIPGGGNITIDQEMRDCFYSFRCLLRDMLCDRANASSGGLMKKCEMGCCEGDLCNSGGPIPTQTPEPTGPSGADLSCLSCSSVPDIGFQANCSNSVRQTCTYMKPYNEDRCLTAKGVGKLLGYNQSMEFEIKNCSNALMCSQGLLCASLNASENGAIESCQVSCCFGNLCNADGTMKCAATTEAFAAYLFNLFSLLSCIICTLYLIA